MKYVLNQPLMKVYANSKTNFKKFNNKKPTQNTQKSSKINYICGTKLLLDFWLLMNFDADSRNDFNFFKQKNIETKNPKQNKEICTKSTFVKSLDPLI